MKSIKILLLISFSILYSCTKDKKNVNEENEITSLKVEVNNVSSSSCKIKYTISKSDTLGIIEYGVVWGEEVSPVVGNDQGQTTIGLIEYDFFVENLKSATTYNARAFVKKSNGSIIYSDNVKFTTQNEIEEPITTLKVAVDSVSGSKSKIKYSIDASDTSGVIEYGIVWGENENPIVGTGNQLFKTDTLEYDFWVNNLNCRTNYNTRAYIKQRNGSVIYSGNLKFTTFRTDDRFIKELSFSKGAQLNTFLASETITRNFGKHVLYFANNLILPEGLYLYAKFTNVKGTILATTKDGTRNFKDGDTLHLPKYNLIKDPSIFYNIDSPNRVIFEPGPDVHPSSLDPNYVIFAIGTINIYVGGTINNTVTNYNCLYQYRGYSTNTNLWMVLESVVDGNCAKCNL